MACDLGNTDGVPRAALVPKGGCGQRASIPPGSCPSLETAMGGVTPVDDVSIVVLALPWIGEGRLLCVEIPSVPRPPTVLQALGCDDGSVAPPTSLGLCSLGNTTTLSNPRESV